MITVTLDELDRRLLALFEAEPRIGVLEASRRLKVARGTVQARLDRLQAQGVVATWAPTIAPAALGYRVTAFITCEIDQAVPVGDVITHLRDVPEILECWSVTGSGDIWCRAVARSNADLQRVIDAMSAQSAIRRTATVIALSEQIPYRTDALVQHAEPWEAPE
ncbi:Lrp/AsnC family transcriptional regulator [Mariniluteicoccus endophyticus]